MGVIAEIIDDKIVLFPSNMTERYGLESVLSLISNNSTDPDSISNSFTIDDELILERNML